MSNHIEFCGPFSHICLFFTILLTDSMWHTTELQHCVWTCQENQLSVNLLICGWQLREPSIIATVSAHWETERLIRCVFVLLYAQNTLEYNVCVAYRTCSCIYYIYIAYSYGVNANNSRCLYRRRSSALWIHFNKNGHHAHCNVVSRRRIGMQCTGVTHGPLQWWSEDNWIKKKTNHII